MAHQKYSQNGRIHMTDASLSLEALNSARAVGKIFFKNGVRKIIFEQNKPKADVITTARIAGIQAAKRTHEFIPLHHSNPVNWIEIDFEAGEDHIDISATIKGVSRLGLEMEALTAVSVAALTLFDFCKEHDPEALIQDIRIIPKEKKQPSFPNAKPLQVGVLVISDRIIAKLANDDAGQILKKGFEDAGCKTSHYNIIANDPDKLVEKVQGWMEQGVDLIITSGGNGIGQRDITLQTLEPFFDFRINGIEQSLYNIASLNNDGFYCDRVAAGKIGKTIVICLPLDSEIAENALNILLPNIHQAFAI